MLSKRLSIIFLASAFVVGSTSKADIDWIALAKGSIKGFVFGCLVPSIIQLAKREASFPPAIQYCGFGGTIGSILIFRTDLFSDSTFEKVVVGGTGLATMIAIAYREQLRL